MLDQGFGDGDLALRLHQLKFYLRAVVNAILDHKMHCANMTDEEALELLMQARLPVRGRGGRQDHPGEAEFVPALDLLRGPDGVLPLAADRSQREMGDKFDLGRYPRGGAGPRHAAGEVSAGTDESSLRIAACGLAAPPSRKRRTQIMLAVRTVDLCKWYGRPKAQRSTRCAVSRWRCPPGNVSRCSANPDRASPPCSTSSGGLDRLSSGCIEVAGHDLGGLTAASSPGIAWPRSA